MKYKFSLVLIFIIFICLSISDLESPGVNFNTMNRPIGVSNTFGSGCVRRELEDLTEIKQVSRKLKEESLMEDLKVKIKSRSGKSSIYVEALTSMASQRRLPDRSKGLAFNVKDK